ncbi:hypothetical protein GCM10025868_12990 [Angustibacter aerolatus]|uniref:Peptidase M41 domain-containing protein n=1 Tax=Angustibacter aerolatus TaxID=1162965 RepID=A0ABQ6JF59_9ACTN|nr:hypothetical protein [Angustibacter aerolatus]GMA86049.1 hypothetical protein GCM10025868_12990 [Angustibacter aerolatus]
MTQVGIGQPVTYTAHEERLIATHEAGHATVAWLVAPTRRLEVLTIIKRGDALGLLAHDDGEEVFTQSRTEMLGLMQIAMGGQVAEEPVLRRRVDRPGRRPAVRHEGRGEHGGRGRHGRHPHLVRGGRAGCVRRRRDRRQGARRLGRTPDGRGPAAGPARRRPRACWARTGTSSRRCATRCSTGTRLIGHDITDVLEAARAARADAVRVIDLTEAADRVADRPAAD